MNGLTYILTWLGDHFMLVFIGCLELLAAVMLLGGFSGKKNGTKQGYSGIKGAERVYLERSAERKEEVCLVVRVSDRMPVYAAGDLEGLLGVTLDRLQEDVTELGRFIKSSDVKKSIWNRYKNWDGKSCLCRELETLEGEWIYFSVQRSSDGTYDLLIFRQDTESHRKLESYERRLEAAEEASQSKTTFLSRMSHEIRTPLNGITGMLTLAQSKMEPEDPARTYLEKAEELSDHLLSLINDILDMSRIEAGKVELEQQHFRVRELGERLYDMFAKTLESRGIHYAVNYEGLTVDWVLGDELRISQVIINFLSNAVKFTEKGEVTVTFRQMLLKDGVVDLMIRVHDTGIGMKPEFINRIFRPFEQEGIEISKKYGGTGLGMAISDQIVRLMGGEIVVESTLGKGSDFSVFLHLPVAEQPEREQEEQRSTEEDTEGLEVFRGRRILMAEDNGLNAMIAREILSEKGAEVEIAEDGGQAVDLFASHPEQYYDYILMDIQMPVLDGREATRKIRAMKRADAKIIPIFGLSADAFVEDERLSIECGMNGHYAKPIDYDILEKNVGRFLREREQGRI